MRGTYQVRGNTQGNTSNTKEIFGALSRLGIVSAVMVGVLVFLFGTPGLAKAQGFAKAQDTAKSNARTRGASKGYVISSSPSSFTFSYTIGSAVPASQSATINDTTPNALPFIVATDEPWITTSAVSGTTKAVLQFGVNPSGLAAGTYSGHVIISAAIVDNSPLSVPVTLTVTGASPVVGALSASPLSVAFGNVTMGSSGSQSVTLTNSGAETITISQASVSGSGFSMSGMSTPMTIAAGKTASVGVKFAPPVAGSYSGSLSVASNATDASVAIALSGTGVQAASSYVVSSTPASFVFSYVTGAAAPATQAAVIDDTSPNALAFTVSTDQPWVTTSAKSGVTKATLQIGVNPSGMAAGIYSGNVFITASGVSNSPLAVPIVLTITAGTSAGTLSASPTSFAFGTVNAGSNSTKSTTITNTGSSSVTISQVSVTGAGVSATGITTPLTLAAGQTTVLSVAFAPQSVGAIAGSASIVSNATNSPLTIAVTGTGAQPTLTASPSSYNFGSVNVSGSGSKSFTVSNSGTASLTISATGISGPGYTMSGLTTPTTLAAGASTSFTVQFAPTAAGAISGSVTLTSNSPNSPTTITLSGTGVAAAAHSVALSWTASTSTVSGYNVYVGSVSGGPYTLVNTGLVAGTTFTDSNVVAGATYYFVVTAVSANGTESVVSSEVSAIIP